MKIALYQRVSTSEQSVQAQRIELMAWVERKKWTVVAEIADEGWSGSAMNRPGMDRLLGMVRGAEIEAVVVVKLDRVARSLGQFADFVRLLDKYGVAFICTSQGIDTSKENACGRLQMNILSSVAEFERDLIKERTRAGMAAARARGAVIGRPSLKLVGVDREAACSTWQSEGRPGGYRGLGERLGGVGKMTAWRIFRDRAGRA